MSLFNRKTSSPKKKWGLALLRSPQNSVAFVLDLSQNYEGAGLFCGFALNNVSGTSAEWRQSITSHLQIDKRTDKDDIIASINSLFLSLEKTYNYNLEAQILCFFDDEKSAEYHAFRFGMTQYGKPLMTRLTPCIAAKTKSGVKSGQSSMTKDDAWHIILSQENTGCNSALEARLIQVFRQDKVESPQQARQVVLKSGKFDAWTLWVAGPDVSAPPTPQKTSQIPIYKETNTNQKSISQFGSSVLAAETMDNMQEAASADDADNYYDQDEAVAPRFTRKTAPPKPQISEHRQDYPQTYGTLAWPVDHIFYTVVNVKGKKHEAAGMESQDSIVVRDPQSYGPKQKEKVLSLFRERGVLFIVADGVGGGAIGDRVSSVAAKSIADRYYDESIVWTSNPIDALTNAVLKINEEFSIWNEQKPRSEQRFTTCVAVVVHGDTAHVVWLGDSQAFLIRDGNVKFATTPSEWQNDDGTRGPWVIGDRQSSRHIKNARWPLLADDTLVLCSDGLTRVLEPSRIADIVSWEIQKGGGTETAVKRAGRKLFKIADTSKRIDDTSFIIARSGINAVEPSLLLVPGKENRKGSSPKNRFLRIGIYVAIIILALIAVLVAVKTFFPEFGTPVVDTSQVSETVATIEPPATRTPMAIAVSTTSPGIAPPILPTNTPTATPTPTATSTPTATPTSTPTNTPTFTPTYTPYPPTSTPTPRPLSAPTLLSPANNKKFLRQDVRSIRFTWHSNELIDGRIQFEILIQSIEDPNNPITIMNELVSDSPIDIPITRLDKDGKYQWKVRLKTQGSNSLIGPWSEPLYFRIDEKPNKPSTPTPIP